MHNGTCVTHVPWSMSGSLTSGGWENISVIPGACPTLNFTYLARGPWVSSCILQITRMWLIPVNLSLQWRHNGRDGASIQPIAYSTVYSGADQRKHQSSASLAFVRGIHRWPVNSPHNGPVTRKMFPFDDVIMASKRSHRKPGMIINELLLTWNTSILSLKHCTSNISAQGTFQI